MPDGHNVGYCQPGSLDSEKHELVEEDDDSQCTSSLEYDPGALDCGSPPNRREERRMKARYLHGKKAEERAIIAHLDKPWPQKKRSVKDTRKSRHDRTHKLQCADTDSSSPVASNSVSASTNVVKVDSHNRIMCLNPKPVVRQDDMLPDNDSVPASQRSSLPLGESDCPSDRYDFYRTFSTLIRLGSAIKKEKEPKAGGGLFSGSLYTRQMSTEQELWQTHLCDLIWFELQAYINVRTNKDQDDFLCDARRGINSTLDRVMNFSASAADNSQEQFSTNDLPAECFCHKRQSGYSGACLRQVIRNQCVMSETVTSLLDDVENAESLYPTQKALAGEHSVYAEVKFQQRIATLCLWKNITRDIAHKIKLMAEIIHISDQSLVGTAWSCVDLHSLKTLVSGYSGKEGHHCSADDDGNDEDAETVSSFMTEISSDCDHAASVLPRVILEQKNVHFEDDESRARDAHFRSECRRSHVSRADTPTSIYRLYVDALLKKTGLRKLRVRLKELLDTTLQRARLALLPACYNCHHGISHISKVW